MNKIELIGKFTKEFEYSHERNGMIFYKSILEVQRQSGNIDRIPVIAKEQYLLTEKDFVSGSLRVFNRRGRSYYYVYADYIYPMDNESINKIELEGNITSFTEKRVTPSGKRIQDVMLIADDTKIPLIFWNKLSEMRFEIGQSIHIVGRLQSREYTKIINSGDVEKRVSIEVSVNNLL